MFKIHTRKEIAGFTLLESLVAIFIFSMALAALMVITSRGINATNVARGEITAHFLAQEGVESVRNRRDQNWEQQVFWLEGISPECSTSSGCMLDTGNFASGFQFEECDDFCSGVVFDEVTNRYVDERMAGDGVGTVFRRTISVVDNAQSQDGVIVRSRVDWQVGAIPRSVVLETYLAKWK